MATVEGLNLRGGRFYLRVLIPEDLQAAHGGKTRVNLSLRTGDRATAVLNGLRAKAQWLEEFAAMRSCQPLPHTGSTAAEALLAQSTGIHQANTKSSSNPIEAHSATRGATATSYALPKPTGLQRCGSPIQGQGMTVWEVYVLWQKAAHRSKDTEQVYARALTLTEKCLGQPLHITQITRSQGNALKAWLQAHEQGFTPKTSKNYLSSLQSLLRFAQLELEVIPVNPWQGLSIKVPKTITRRPWKDAELQTLFSQPLFQSYALPDTGRAGGGAAAYWIPLLGLYTGARIGELAQLRIQDITCVDGTPVIQITDADEGLRLKTSASRRCIPIHPELIRLGLLTYVEDLQAPPYSLANKAPKGSLWPLLNASAAQQGNLISSWFSRYRKSIGLTGTYPDFHCLRHTVRTKMAHAKVSEHVMDAITGHETGGSTGRKVYQHLELNDLTTAIQSIAYSAITLPKVYKIRSLLQASTEVFNAQETVTTKSKASPGMIGSTAKP